MADEEPDERVKARADGLKYVLFKPFKPDQLVAAVLDLPKQ